MLQFPPPSKTLSINQSKFNVRFLTRRRCQGRPRRDVKLQTATNHQNTPANTHAKRESEIQNSASPLSKARRSVRTDLRWEEMSLELALESSNACTRSQTLWQRIP